MELLVLLAAIVVFALMVFAAREDRPQMKRIDVTSARPDDGAWLGDR